MSLNFGAATSNRVDISLDAQNDALAAGFSILTWVYPTTRTNGRRFWSLFGNDGADYLHSIHWNFDGDGTETVVVRSTTPALLNTSDTWTMNKWWFLAVTYDETDGLDAYRGDLTTLASQLTYRTDTTGSGSTRDSGVANHRLANASTSTSFRGLMARFIKINRKLTLQEVISRQFYFLSDADTTAHFELGYNGTGTQPNYSAQGQGASGTVSGATVSVHPRLPFMLGRSPQPRYAVAPAATQTPSRMLTGVGT